MQVWPNLPIRQSGAQVKMEMQFPPGTPPEVQEYLRDQYARHQMTHQADMHAIQTFFDELSIEQLTTLRKIFGVADDVDGMMDYYQGVIATTLRLKYNVCANCGVDHDKEALGEAFMPPTAVIIDTPQTGPVPSFVDHLERPHPSVAGWMPQADPAPAPVAACGTCHGDLYLRVCNHAPGSHGQEKTPCPDPLKVPCPECRCPEWYVGEDLVDSSCHAAQGGKLLPTYTNNRFVCSECGREVLI